MFKKENLLTAIFLLIIGVLVAMAIFSSFVNKEEVLQPLKTTTDMEFVIEDQPLAGDENAPVTMTVFYDYNCSHCQKWDTEVLPVIEEVILDSGIANLRFVNYPFMYPSSTYAAMAGELVHNRKPSSFLDFHRELYENQAAINVNFLAKKVNEYIPELSIDQAKEEIVNQRYADHAISDKEYGLSIGVNATPTFFVGDVKVENSGDLQNIVDLVNEQASSNIKSDNTEDVEKDGFSKEE
jgi:protein-disulfide isomerase